MKEDEAPARDSRGLWLAGRSANPKGRPPNVGSSARLRKAISDAMPQVLEKLIAAALAGDIGAARALLPLTVPALKPVEEATPIALPADATLTAQGAAVFAAVARGEMAAGQGAALLASLADLARLRAEDDHEARLQAIEAAQAAQQGQST